MNCRTDIALERQEMLADTDQKGIKVKRWEKEKAQVTEIEILNEYGANTLQKPIGRYITVDLPEFSHESELLDGRLTALTETIKNLLPTSAEKILVAGLGNENITPDALGPLCVKGIFSTRHIKGEIIKDLGEEHLRTGALIVYTSADSVLQIAANEDIVPLEELYDICRYARQITIENPEWMVGRIIARPFLGTSKENFYRTTNRHDYALKPFDKTALNHLSEKGFDTIAVGKINDIFDGYGITKFMRTVSNEDGMDKTLEIAKSDFNGLCFVNLVDFDALYGHRRDILGYKEAIERFDEKLGLLLENIDDETMVIITADHGNDPVHHGTDHTREDVPLLIYYNGVKGKELTPMISFANIASTILINFDLEPCVHGEGFNKELE